METYVPYNRKNRESDIRKILKNHGLPGYRIQNPKVFQQAMSYYRSDT